MKKLLTLSLCLVLLGPLGDCLAKPLRNPDGSPNGNKHDLSKDNTGAAIHADKETRVCVFCHTPHGATPQSTLWNRPDPQAAQAFVLYGDPDSIEIDNIGAAQYSAADTSAYPNGATRMCLSCHDGAVALGTVVNGPIEVGDVLLSTTLGGSMVVDLATSHPVSFVYDVGNDGIPDAVVNGINAVKGAAAYALPTLSDVPLDSQGRMQCTTCHDPHNDTRAELVEALPFWRHTSGSPYDDVCNTCHIDDAHPAQGTNH